MQNGLSDKELMLQNYCQDDSNHGNHTSNNTTATARDPHKKRNAIFNFTNEDLNSGTASTNSSLSSGTTMDSITNRPGIDDTVLTDTMKKFLDKSVRQALEDSHRRAMEEGAPFIITPAIEKHLRNLSPGQEMMIEDTIKRWKNDTENVNKKTPAKQIKETKVS